MTEKEYEDLMLRRGLVPVGKMKPAEHLRLVLPFKLPTWNQLLGMGHWQRAKVREWIKKRVSECIQSENVLLTPTESVRRLSLTDLSLAEYSEMITPNSSKKYRSAKKSAKLRKP